MFNNAEFDILIDALEALLCDTDGMTDDQEVETKVLLAKLKAIKNVDKL